jgi:hypothetical protein
MPNAVSSGSEKLLRIRSLAGYIAVRNDFDKRRQGSFAFPWMAVAPAFCTSSFARDMTRSGSQMETP